MRRAGLGVAETFTALSDECYDSRTVRGMPIRYGYLPYRLMELLLLSMSPKESRGAPPPQQVAQQFAVNQTARITLLEQQQ